MDDLKINLGALFTFCFQIFRKYASFIIGVTVTYLILGIIPQLYLYVYTPKNPTTGDQILSVVATLVQLFLSLGFTKIMLLLIDHREVEVSDLINNGSIFLSYFVAYFLYVIAVVIGLFLLIIPGVILAVRLQFYPFYVIEEGVSSFTALQKSWYATDRGFFHLLLFGICVVALNFAGAFFFGIGLIFTYPLTTLAMAVVYKCLKQEAQQIPTETYLPDKAVP